ncbi:uncharacterized protein BCR38DRAFT_405095 [Pseudomassariella vexata]|uniref:Uncharacterized protein n=1 Tax=Pseudomassariella vexata TaxID=1141098 RepID=A0A1Y2EKM1_9PEZI|nr:uncharacterized protein BCR38DRAFT_405095 [Pseudomassariella vexata]ORY72087.1 hypothetical protein BCR38DRAFT_405095 [Pseudomassariella vexata]
MAFGTWANYWSSAPSNLEPDQLQRAKKSNAPTSGSWKDYWISSSRPNHGSTRTYTSSNNDDTSDNWVANLWGKVSTTNSETASPGTELQETSVQEDDRSFSKWVYRQLNRSLQITTPNIKLKILPGSRYSSVLSNRYVLMFILFLLVLVTLAFYFWAKLMSPAQRAALKKYASADQKNNPVTQPPRKEEKRKQNRDIGTSARTVERGRPSRDFGTNARTPDSTQPHRREKEPRDSQASDLDAAMLVCHSRVGGSEDSRSATRPHQRDEQVRPRREESSNFATEAHNTASRSSQDLTSRQQALQKINEIIPILVKSGYVTKLYPINFQAETSQVSRTSRDAATEGTLDASESQRMSRRDPLVPPFPGSHLAIRAPVLTSQQSNTSSSNPPSPQTGHRNALDTPTIAPPNCRRNIVRPPAYSARAPHFASRARVPQYSAGSIGANPFPQSSPTRINHFSEVPPPYVSSAQQSPTAANHSTLSLSRPASTNINEALPVPANVTEARPSPPPQPTPTTPFRQQPPAAARRRARFDDEDIYQRTIGYDADTGERTIANVYGNSQEAFWRRQEQVPRRCPTAESLAQLSPELQDEIMRSFK